MAEVAGAYWLIDVIASWVGSHSFNRALEKNPKITALHYWSIEVYEDRTATVQALVDSDNSPFSPEAFITQKIPFTDFVLDEFNVWCGFDGKH